MAHHENRTLLRAREVFLETGALPEGFRTVRPEIAASWHRSRLSGVDPEGVEPDYCSEVTAGGRLGQAAAPVLDKLGDELTGSSTCIILADRAGRIMRRWADDSTLHRLLDRARSQVGFTLSETVVGTNGVGTVYETNRATQVVGAEHFANQYLPFACVGVPIRHPVNRQLTGVLDVTCRAEDANGVLLPWALEVAREIEERLHEQASRTERLLLDRFLATARNSSYAVVCLNDSTIISNPAAARMLDGIDQAFLWEHAARTIAGRDVRDGSILLSSGEEVRARYRPVRDGRAIVGALIEAATGPPPGPRASRRRLRATAPVLPGLAGHGKSWQRVCEQARRIRDDAIPVLLTGEVGAGKNALARAILAGGGPVTVFDAALYVLDGFAAWAAKLRHRLADQTGAVLLRHLEALDRSAAQTVCAILDDSLDRCGALFESADTAGTPAGSCPRLVATVSTGPDVPVPYPPLVDRFAVALIEVPPLRDRVEDLPDLLATFTRRHGGTSAQYRWLPDAVQTLSRLDWPGNLRQLENVVRRVLATHPGGDIGARDLPRELRGGAPRRRLTHLERLELSAIMAALEQTRGNKVEAAQLLEISRSTLYRKLRAFGVDLDRTAF